MTLLNYPIIIPIHSGNGSPMTDKDIKILLGIFILLNILWVISWVISLIRFKFNFKEANDHRSDSYFEVFDMIMYFIWGILVLYFGGTFIASFL